MPVKRRKLNEIVSISRREPSIRHVYVEGYFDKYIVNEFLKRKGRLDISTYKIDVVNICSDLILKYGLNRGSNRSRLIALGRELEVLAPNWISPCIIDKDFNFNAEEWSGHTNILHTDYNSMDMYLFNSNTIDKFFTTACHGLNIGGEETLSNLAGSLVEIYLIRAANEALQWGMTEVKLDRYIKFDNGLIGFKKDGYISAYLGSNRKLSERVEFDEAMENIQESLDGEYKNYIRGRDFIYVLDRSVNYMKNGRVFSNIERFKDALWGCLEIEDIQDEQLFEKLAGI